MRRRQRGWTPMGWNRSLHRRSALSRPGQPGRLSLAATLALAVILGIAGWTANPAFSQDAPPGRVLQIYSVGGVLTADGTLWQYTPQKVWRTIDEAFREQGKETHILPLPVPPESIADMVTFGFLFTTSGECWLYDLETDQWNKLDPPH